MENEEVSQDTTGVITGGDTTVSPPVPQPAAEPVQVEAPEQAAPEIVVPEAVVPSEQVMVEETVSQPETAPEAIQVSDPEAAPTPQPMPQSVQTVEPAVQQTVVNTPTNKIIELLLKAREKIQLKKRLKLEKIMGLFAKKPRITNDEIEKVLHVSDSTATRYLDQLEKENKITQNGKTGKGVMYTKN